MTLFDKIYGYITKEKAMEPLEETSDHRLFMENQRLRAIVRDQNSLLDEMREANLDLSRTVDRFSRTLKLKQAIIELYQQKWEDKRA